MKDAIILLTAMLFSASAYSQNILKAVIRDGEKKESLSAVSVLVQGSDLSARSDQSGYVELKNIPDGSQVILFRYPGYKEHTETLQFPLGIDTLKISLQAEQHELEAVIVSSTRSSRTIDNIPTRIEVIAGEELDEKSNMKPGDIRMVLNESTGIQTQQTSATSANASIRIQGLDGRYTQILKDGFPMFSGAASGLGLLQIPPLDLKQVEVIKGSASTLYGGGAIAGLVNLVSKTPSEERELKIQLNATTAGGVDINSFFGQRFGKAGITVFASRNSNKAYDPAKIDLTAIPKFERYTLNPKFYLSLNERTSFNLGMNSSFEKRIGGDIHFIEGNGDNIHQYFEDNNSDRLSSQFSFKHQLDAKSELNLRNSVSYFKRLITVPGYQFDGTQYFTFSELNYTRQNTRTEWITGLNLWTDNFRENLHTVVPLRSYRQTTVGGFVQNNTHAANWLELEAGLRGDYVIDYGFVLLPRISALFKISDKLNSRFGGGLGYKTPTIFTEESERIEYQDVLPISSSLNKLEKSYGLSWDFNYRTLFSNKVSFSINHLFFYTLLDNPLYLLPSNFGQQRFENLTGHIDTRGMETNIKLGYTDFKLFFGYTFTDTKLHSNGALTQTPLTAKHRLNNVLMYEVEDKWKIGAEAYYYSKQKLNDGNTGKPYWIYGFMVEKLWEQFSVYINFENFTDTRQTRFDSIYSGTVSNPVFKDIYAPLDGFVMNGGLKISL